MNSQKIELFETNGGEGITMNADKNKKYHFFIDIVCIGIIIGMIVYTFYSILQMPENIPIHVNGNNINGWGSRWISLIMPSIILFTHLFYHFLIKLYLEKQKQNQQIIFIKWVQLACVIIFSIVNIFFIQFVFDNI